jgi:group I intron endonuclease
MTIVEDTSNQENGLVKSSGGIYSITNTSNGMVYIGKTITSFDKRWGNHKSYLRTGKHPNRCLQKDWGHYGESAFTFAILERGYDGVDLSTLERKWLYKYRLEILYNFARETRCVIIKENLFTMVRVVLFC